MTNVDYVIVGGGYAGFFFAHQLILNSKSFVLISDENKVASEVSAGIINPVVLKRFTTFWLAAEQIEFLEKTLREIETYTGKNYLVNERIYRIFHDVTEKNLWLKKADTPELKPFLDTNFYDLEDVNNPFGAGAVNHSGRLDVKNFFSDFKTYLETNKNLLTERFNYGELKDRRYKDIHFENIVFCEGMGVKNNPFFHEIPVAQNKGHHLKVKLSEPLQEYFTLKKKHFLFPVADELHYYGGTYDRFETGEEIDESAILQLQKGLSAFYPHEFEIKEVNFGWRPTLKDRRPILGSHAEMKNYFVFNGLGARGILNGCYFAKELFDHIENGKPLLPEVDLKRF